MKDAVAAATHVTQLRSDAASKGPADLTEQQQTPRSSGSSGVDATRSSQLVTQTPEPDSGGGTPARGTGTPPRSTGKRAVRLNEAVLVTIDHCEQTKGTFLSGLKDEAERRSKIKTSKVV